MGVELVVTETQGLSSTEHRRALDVFPRWRVVAMVTSWRYVFITWIVPTLQRGNIAPRAQRSASKQSWFRNLWLGGIERRSAHRCGPTLERGNDVEYSNPTQPEL